MLRRIKLGYGLLCLILADSCNELACLGFIVGFRFWFFLQLLATRLPVQEITLLSVSEIRVLSRDLLLIDGHRSVGFKMHLLLLLL